jgi:hypothetical protein
VSSFVLSKLDIDVLMQLAVHGPIGMRPRAVPFVVLAGTASC